MARNIASEVAVDAIARRQFPVDSEVCVISVFEPLSLLTRSYAASVDMRIYDGLEKAMHERARAAVEKATAKLLADNDGRIRNVTMAVLAGVPKRAILEEAKQIRR